MKEYIERTTILNLLGKINPVDFGSMFDYEAHSAVQECLREISYGVENISAADVAPVVRAKWEPSDPICPVWLKTSPVLLRNFMVGLLSLPLPAPLLRLREVGAVWGIPVKAHALIVLVPGAGGAALSHERPPCSCECRTTGRK